MYDTNIEINVFFLLYMHVYLYIIHVHIGYIHIELLIYVAAEH